MVGLSCDWAVMTPGAIRSHTLWIPTAEKVTKHRLSQIQHVIKFFLKYLLEKCTKSVKIINNYSQTCIFASLQCNIFLFNIPVCKMLNGCVYSPLLLESV